ncbi:uncharacterized protein LOC124380119 isoform X1, partial [Tachysurus ichikawai]
MGMTAQEALDHLSPYELVMGRPFLLPWRRGKQALGTGDLDVHLSEYSTGMIKMLNDYLCRLFGHLPRCKPCTRKLLGTEQQPLLGPGNVASDQYGYVGT